MKKILILTLTLFAPLFCAAQREGDEIARIATEKHGQPQWIQIEGWQGQWAANYAAQIISPRLGPLFYPRVWADKAGHSFQARITAVSTPGDNLLIFHFANGQGNFFDLPLEHLLAEDQVLAVKYYGEYLLARIEFTNIRRAIASARTAATTNRTAPPAQINRYQARQQNAPAPRLPAPSAPPAQNHEHAAIERRLQEMEAAAAEMELTQEKLKRRQEEAEAMQRLHRQQQRFNSQNYTNW